MSIIGSFCHLIEFQINDRRACNSPCRNPGMRKPLLAAKGASVLGRLARLTKVILAKGLAKHNGKAPRSVGANDADVDDGQTGWCRDGMYAALARADRAVLRNHNRRSPVRFRHPLPANRDPVRVAFSCCAGGKSAADQARRARHLRAALICAAL